MTSRELLYVKTIADEKSITRAAQKLYLTQPSLSHCVMNIEKQLGTRLFRRTSGGLVLTYAGEKYYRMACEVLRVYAAFESEISEESELIRGRITLGITNYLACDLLPRMLPAFHRNHPGIEIRVVEETTDMLEKSLLSGRLDFAIMHTGAGDGASEDPGLWHEVLRRDPFLLLAPQDHRFRDKAVLREGKALAELDPALLDGEPFLMVSRGQRIRHVVDRVLQTAGISPQIVFTSRNYETLRRLCAEGMGYTFVPSHYIGLLGGEEYQSACYTVPERYNAFWELSVVTLKDAYLSRAAKAFLKSFKESIQQEI
ncbi:MAG: LysR family transcriptional regulator [Clostridia bacterium]|nr:LysR family transcriptional regulator [Clostridia bacterium]